jgi:hypothetical protein
MYKVNEYDIEDYVKDIGLIHKFKHYLIFNDIISKYLHIHHQKQYIEYIIRGMGLRAGKNRLEVCYYR